VATDRLCSLAAGTILDVGPVDAPGVARAGGWDAVGIWFDAATWTERTTAAVSAALRDHDVIALDVEPVILGPDGDPGEALIDAAIAIGARNVLVASRVPPSNEVIARYGALCDRASAGSESMRVVLEFLPIFGVRTLADALEVVRVADRPNGGVLVDTLHLARSGGSPNDVRSVPARLLPYLQLADAPAIPPDGSLRGLTYEALHGRLLPGSGALPLQATLAAVPDIPVSVELRSSALMRDYPDPVMRAKTLLTATKSVTDAH